MVDRPKWDSTPQLPPNPRTLLDSKEYEILIIDTRTVSTKDDTRPTLVYTRVHQRNSTNEQYSWSRARNWTQGVSTRVQVFLKYEKMTWR